MKSIYVVSFGRNPVSLVRYQITGEPRRSLIRFNKEYDKEIEQSKDLSISEAFSLQYILSH